MNQHQHKVVPQNGLVMGQCYRGVCKCGWMSRLYPISAGGSQKAIDRAQADATQHSMSLDTQLAMPDFMIHLNENPFGVIEEPIWKK